MHLNCTSLNKTKYNPISNSPDARFARCIFVVCLLFTFNDIEDDLEFMNCLFNFLNVDSGNKINANLIKNPHQLQLISTIKLVDSDIDPDKQLLEPVVSSNDKYYLESEFHQFILNENTVGKLSIWM